MRSRQVGFCPSAQRGERAANRHGHKMATKELAGRPAGGNMPGSIFARLRWWCWDQFASQPGMRRYPSRPGTRTAAFLHIIGSVAFAFAGLQVLAFVVSALDSISLGIEIDFSLLEIGGLCLLGAVCYGTAGIIEAVNGVGRDLARRGGEEITVTEPPPAPRPVAPPKPPKPVDPGLAREIEQWHERGLQHPAERPSESRDHPA
ncbi:MAG: hypothetical protein GY715_16220 [Planctomycetes bacterium]|nr:hypothetical protein [Planctomycetota bacterium]